MHFGKNHEIDKILGGARRKVMKANQKTVRAMPSMRNHSNIQIKVEKE